jgi:hypothetical protein
MAVAALRDVFGVPHPAFLSWPAADAVDVSAGDDSASADRPDEPLAVMPESADHLRTLAAAALTPPGGPAIEFDEEGDIPLPMGSALVWVRVHETAPVVELFSSVVRGAFDRERAAFEVAVLNRDTRMVKFVLLDDAVLATVHLPAMPFAPRHLRAMAAAMADVVDRVDDDLVARVGGRRALDPEPDEDETAETFETAEEEGEDGEAAEEQGLHPALLTLLHLDPEGEGVDPDLAASVCDDDRDLVLALLTAASEQEIAWRKSGNHALIAEDGDEARACFHECQAWLATVETLRAALRVIVERRHAESSAAQATGAGTERGGIRRARRRTRPRQQSLIDDAVIRRSSTGQDSLFERDSDD